MEFSVVLTNTMYIDKILWKLWLLGLTIDQCTILLKDRREKSFIISQFRNFELLEPWLHRPKSLYTQMLLWLPPIIKSFLIQSYYSFDERVIREILGKKLNSRARKELDEIVSKTKIPLNGCRRMFDNFKRVSKRLEDTTGSLVDTIQYDFLLTRELAMQYSNIIFLNYYKIDTFKKKLSYLRFSDFEYIGSALMEYFTYRKGSILDELDSGLCQDSRDFKYILFNSKDTLDELKALVSSNSDGFIDKISINTFKTIIRSILVIGAGLVHAKELKDVILNIQEKIVEPSVSLGWSASDTDNFFTVLIESFSKMKLSSIPGQSSTLDTQRRRWNESFNRLILGIKTAAVRMHQQATNASSR